MRLLTFLLLLLLAYASCQREWSALDNLLPIFRKGRQFFLEIFSQHQKRDLSPLRLAKLQDRIDLNVRFPCDVVNARSPVRPNSVHQLRPGDIDIIGALGDSLTAGFGASAINVLEVLTEERGKSFTIGGEADWRTYLTLPNILKVFNPNLIGFSSKTGSSVYPGAGLNVGEGSATSGHMPYMAAELIRRIKSIKTFNATEQWKMVTIFIGSNDFCLESCYMQDALEILEKHRKELLLVLRMLKKNLPRTIVNLIPPPHLSIIVDNIVQNPICDITRKIECPCLFGLPNANKRGFLYDLMRRWQLLDLEIGDLPEFDSEEFTVVVQPFSLNYTVPKVAERVIDERFLSADCFHFSQRMHARVANNLWNCMLEPVGGKSFDGDDIMKEFRCPTQQYPYIFTRRNS